MNFHILTLFPEMINAGLNTSITGRAIDAGLISVDAINIREFTNEKHGHVDDTPYGGGAGMVMSCQPIYDAWIHVCEKINGPEKNGSKEKTRVIYTSPSGKVFNQDMAKELAKEKNLIILCGHYEGVDERVLELMEAESVSIGDYVLTGGELPAMVMVDAISRMVPGVLTNEQSGVDESFSDVYPGREFTRKVRASVYGNLNKKTKPDEEEYSLKLLEYPQYTRPEEFMGLKVPEILLSGNHANIDAWRRKQSVEKTKRIRPDLIK